MNDEVRKYFEELAGAAVAVTTEAAESVEVIIKAIVADDQVTTEERAIVAFAWLIELLATLKPKEPYYLWFPPTKRTEEGLLWKLTLSRITWEVTLKSFKEGK